MDAMFMNVRTPQIPVLFLDEPEFAEMLEQQRAILTAEKHEVDRWNTYFERRREAMEKHDKAVDRAIETMSPVPEPFVPEPWVGPDYDDPNVSMAARWTDKLQANVTAQHELFVELAPQLRERLKRRADYRKAEQRRAKALAELEAAERQFQQFDTALDRIREVLETPQERQERADAMWAVRRAERHAEQARSEYQATIPRHGVEEPPRRSRGRNLSDR